MNKNDYYFAFLLLICSSEVCIQAVSSENFLPIVISDAIYNKTYKHDVNESMEYIFKFQNIHINLLERAQIEIEAINASLESPLIIVVKQQYDVMSWQIPFRTKSKTEDGMIIYNSTTQTLCTSQQHTKELNDNSHNYITVTISTASQYNITFTIIVTIMDDFYISSLQKKEISISPARHLYYGYKFSNDTSYESVVLLVTSQDNICMTLAIQNVSCPVHGLNGNFEFSGYWQTIIAQGAMTISKNEYPNGFFIVFYVMTDDSDCFDFPKLVESRTKNIVLTIIPSITWKDYIYASFLLMSVMLGFCLTYVTLIVYKIVQKRKRMLREELEDLVDDNVDSVSTTQASNPSIVRAVPANPYRWDQDDDSSLADCSIDLMDDVFSDKDIVRTKLVLAVCDLTRKEPKVVNYQTHLYFYYLLTISIFYFLPVIQLVLTNQYVLKLTGNQDLCYYNFLCAHPMSILSDFNHVLSNFSYVMLGLLFMFITHTKKVNDNEYLSSCYGIPKYYGLYYAMGFALIMQGILSACYHVCPNQTNFQFDTSFMYIIAVICMIQIYQFRHPDINARAPLSFAILALIILLSLIGVLESSKLYWLIFTFIHLITCIYLSAKIYYMGRFKFNCGIFYRIIITIRHNAHSGMRYLFRPIYWKRFVLLALGNICNISLAIYGNLYDGRNFASYLLTILLANLILYTFFYIVMKLCHSEKILLQPLIYIILALISWSAALYFFIAKTISWTNTPAQSREFNRPCVILHFFDYHDIWHFLSAFAMFFSFMVLLTLDNDLVDVHRSQIVVF